MKNYFISSILISSNSYGGLTWIGWWKKGQKAWEWNYKNDIRDGKFTFWDESGLILWKRVYKNDVCISGDCP